MRLWLVSSCVFALSLVAFCQSPDPTSENTPSPGQFSNSIYRNSDLGVTYILSNEWQDNTSGSGSSTILAAGSRILLVADRSAGLMSVDRIVLAALSTEHLTSDLQHFVESFSQHSAQNDGSELFNAGAVLDVGGRKFYRADSKKAGVLSTLYRTYIGTEIQGYFLVWTFASFSDSHLQEMVNTLKTVSIAPDKEFRFRDSYPSPAVYEKDMRQWLLKKVQPVYSEKMIRDNIAGDVVLGLVVGPDGRVRKTRIISGLAPACEAAIQAAMQWKYKPYLLEGRPVTVETEITIHFAARRAAAR